MINAALALLATSRLTSLVTQDEITAPLRDKVEDWALGADYGTLPERIHTGINCPRCVSVWAGAASVALLMMGKPGKAVLGLLAASEATLILKKVVGHDDEE